MADTNTTALVLLKMETDSHDNDWGDQLNANFDKIDEAIAGQATYAVTGGTSVLTANDVRKAWHRVTGVLVSNQIFEVPVANAKLFYWKNETTGNFTVTVKVNGQTGVAIPRGDAVLLRNNGVDVVDAGIGQGIATGAVNWVGTFAFLADAYSAAAVAGLPATLVDGLTIRGLINNANTTAAPTMAYGAGAAKGIQLFDGAAPSIGELAVGLMATFTYRIASDKWHWMNPPVARTKGPATFTKSVSKTTTVLVDAATVAWDLSTGADFQVTITSNRTLGAFTNGVVGQEGILRVIQDGTGGWTLALTNAVYDFWGPSIENIARGANDVTEYDFKVLSAGSMFLKRRGATSTREGGRDFLDEKIAAASATIDFVLTKWLALYDRFEVDFDNVLPATDNVALYLRSSTNGGSSYDAGAAAYVWSLNRNRDGGVDDAPNSGGDTQIIMIPTDTTQGLSNTAGETASGTVTLYSPTVVGPFKVEWRSMHIGASSSSIVDRIRGGGIRATAADVDAVRFLLSSGNITSGTFRLYGVRK